MFQQLHTLAVAIAPEFSTAGLTILRHEPRWPLPRGVAYCGREVEGHVGNIVVFAVAPSIDLFIHELAHLLPLHKFDLDDGAPWKRHGAQFIRRVIHLAYRASLQGHEIDLAGVCAGPFYALSLAADYAAALGDEPERMRGASFAEIDATPLPVPFAELFAADVAQFQRDYPCHACC